MPKKNEGPHMKWWRSLSQEDRNLMTPPLAFLHGMREAANIFADPKGKLGKAIAEMAALVEKIRSEVEDNDESD